MKTGTRVFVSYTRRDGVVTIEMLKILNEKLKSLCVPFIHALEIQYSDSQIYVIRQLVISNFLILIESPDVYNSPWVRLELFLATLRLIPIIKISAYDIKHET